jgi:hypothetical protein
MTPIFIIKPFMETNLNNQLTLKNTELNLTTDAEQRKKITNQLTILKYRKEIEALQQKIKLLQQN